MSNEEMEAKLDALSESARRVQAVAQANSLLLAVIVDNLANCAINRHNYLAGLFDGAGVRADRASVDEQSQQMNDLAREELSKFFASVADSPEHSQSRKSLPDPRASQLSQGARF